MVSAADLHVRLLLVRADINFSAAAADGDCADEECDMNVTMSSSNRRHIYGFGNRFLTSI